MFNLDKFIADSVTFRKIGSRQYPEEEPIKSLFTKSDIHINIPQDVIVGEFVFVSESNGVYVNLVLGGHMLCSYAQ